jgi:hypothetical protein
VLQEVETFRVSRQSVHEGGKVFQPFIPAAFMPQEIFLVLISVKSLSGHQHHSVAGRIKAMKNPNDFIGNLTCSLPACKAVTFLATGHFILPQFFPCPETSMMKHNPSSEANNLGNSWHCMELRGSVPC